MASAVTQLTSSHSRGFFLPLGKVVQTHLKYLVPLPQVVESDGHVGGCHHHQGGTCQDMGEGRDVLVKRGEPVPSDFEGPILVCTRNDDLEVVLDATPTSRWRGLTFLTLVSDHLLLSSVAAATARSNELRETWFSWFPSCDGAELENGVITCLTRNMPRPKPVWKRW